MLHYVINASSSNIGNCKTIVNFTLLITTLYIAQRPHNIMIVFSTVITNKIYISLTEEAC